MGSVDAANMLWMLRGLKSLKYFPGQLASQRGVLGMVNLQDTCSQRILFLFFPNGKNIIVKTPKLIVKPKGRFSIRNYF